MRAVLFCLLLGLLASVPVHAQGNPRDFERPGPAKEREMYYAQVRMEINNTMLLWRDAWERDDVGKLGAFYSDDAVYYPFNAAQAASRPAIQSYFAGFLRTVGNVSMNMTGFGMSGDLAYMTARLTYYVQEEGKQRKVVRTDMIVLRRQRYGDWIIEMHMTQPEPELKPLP